MTLLNQKCNPETGEDRFKFILKKLRNVTVNHHTAKASCPAHNDDNPSLEVKFNPVKEKIQVKCHFGCELNEILKAINFPPQLLYHPNQQRHSKQQQAFFRKRKRIVKVYQYKKLNGHSAFQVVRFDPKDFRCRADEKTWSMKGVERLPYNLPEVSKAINKERPILFVEGEKDADNGMELGFTTTTVPNGAGKWRKEYAGYFHNADLIFLPHNDEPGRAGALRIAKELQGIARIIRFLTLPDLELKGDLSDWIKAGGTKRKLKDLIFLEAIFLNEASLVHKLNKKHAIIMIQGKLAVLNEEFSNTTNRNEITLSTTQHFQVRYIKKSLRSLWKKDDKKTNLQKQANGETNSDTSYSIKHEIEMQGKIWLNSPGRRQYDNFCFDPEGPEIIGNDYNLWKGFAVDPKEGDWSLFKQHIYEIVAQGDKEIYEYLLDWMADAVQNRKKRSGVSIVLRGGQGTGKGSFITLFGKLFGQHFLQIADPRYLVGNFNAHLKDCLILFADEAFYAGDKKHAQILKDFISEQDRQIEFKGKDVQTFPNYTRLMMASNRDWVAPVERDDRRFFILDVSDKVVKDHAYFQALYDQMENQEGREAMLHDLMERDISGVNIQDYPMTQAILDNKLESMNSIGQWIFEGLMSGELLKMPDRNFTVSDMYNNYKEFCEKIRPISYNGWCREMRKYFPHIFTEQKYSEGKRYYNMGTIEQCREAFEDRLKAKIEWDGEENDNA